MIHVASLAAILVAAAVLGFFWIRRAPITLGLAIANLAVFLLTIATSTSHVGIAGSPLLEDLAFRPRYLAEGDWVRLPTILTSAFLHVDLFHVIGNLLILAMLGLPFEERLGRARFLGVYFFGAVIAVLLHMVWQWATGGAAALGTPVVGASGAIFALLGGFAATYPRDEIPMFLIILLLPRVPVIVAALVLSLFEAIALFGAAFSSVAHAAHIGGAVGGAIAAPLLKPRHLGGESDKMAVATLDYDTLHRLAPDERARLLVARVRENSDRPELRKAWLDRLLVRLRCPECGQGFEEVRPGLLECDAGHRETYAR